MVPLERPGRTLGRAITPDTAAWITHVASLAKQSKGATQSICGTVIDGVLLDEIQSEQVVELGPQLVAMKAWDALGLTPILQNLGMNPTAIATAQVMISNRLIEPLSEWALIDWADKLKTDRSRLCSAFRNQSLQNQSLQLHDKKLGGGGANARDYGEAVLGRIVGPSGWHAEDGVFVGVGASSVSAMTVSGTEPVVIITCRASSFA